MTPQVPPAEWLGAFWELSRDLLAIADLDGRFVHVNRRWCEVTGHEPDELRSRPFLDFVHPDDRERTMREARDMATSGRASTAFENRYVRPDGSVVWLHWNASTDLERGLIHAVATDVTARRRSETFVHLLQRVGAAAHASDELVAAVRAAVDEICAVIGWPVGHAYLRDEDDRDRLVPLPVWHLPPGDRLAAFRAVTDATPVRRGESLPGTVLESERPAWVEDVSRDPRFAGDGAPEYHLGAAFAFPVRSGKDTVAVLEFLSEGPAPRDEELLDVMETIGSQLGRVHERTRTAETGTAVEVERRFLSMMTHELRGPLVSIKGFVDLVLARWGEIDDERKVDLLQRVQRATGRLHRLVDTFLDLSRQHAEGFAPRLDSVEVAGALRAALAEPGAVTDVSHDLPDDLVVRADRDFLTQVLLNLLSNAARYGAPPVEVTARRFGDHVHVSVRDHGPGVPADFQQHLFKRFARADRSAGGTGLGLSISRDLARAQGGDLVHEPADPGSRFTLILPAG